MAYINALESLKQEERARMRARLIDAQNRSIEIDAFCKAERERKEKEWLIRDRREREARIAEYDRHQAQKPEITQRPTASNRRVISGPVILWRGGQRIEETRVLIDGREVREVHYLDADVPYTRRDHTVLADRTRIERR